MRRRINTQKEEDKRGMRRSRGDRAGREETRRKKEKTGGGGKEGK